jgi:hypothetical protein
VDDEQGECVQVAWNMMTEDGRLALARTINAEQDGVDRRKKIVRSMVSRAKGEPEQLGTECTIREDGDE